MNAQILVVKPKTLTAADKKLLRESGVVCIESADPQSVRMLTPEGPELSCNDLFRAAMLAIADSTSDGPRNLFARNMAAMLKACPKKETP